MNMRILCLATFAISCLSTDFLFAACEQTPLLDKLRVPPGFKISVFSDKVKNARQLARGEKGTIFVGSRREGKVYAVVDQDGDFCADQVYVLAEGLTLPSGVAYRNGALYVGEVSKIWRLDNIEAHLDNPPKRIMINDRLPNKKHHGWKNIAFGPDGFLYVPVGSPCNTCLEKNEIFGTILRMDVSTGDWTVYARGIRNSVGFDWHPESKALWFTENGRDMWGDDRPPDEINRVSAPGDHFGFPYYYGNDLADTDYPTAKKAQEFSRPAFNLRAHVAPLGMLFYTGKMFPQAYRNQIIYAEHGSWNRTVPQGYRLATLFVKNGKVSGNADLVTGFLDADGESWGRPVAPLQLPDGSLLISDDKLGVIYRLSYAVE